MPIKHCPIKSRAVDLLAPGVHIWGYEKKNGNGAMSFIVGTHAELIDMYLNCHGKRYHHELLLDDAHPIKLFFDIDGPPDTLPQTTENLHQYVSDQLGGCDPPMILDASDKNKYSKHLIYPLAFTNKAVLREFVYDLRMIIPESDPLSKLIDFGVYNTDHSLRIIGSLKRKVGRPFLFENRPKLSRSVLERSLIRHVSESDTIINTWGNQEIQRHGIKRVRYSLQPVEWEGWTQEMLDNISTKLSGYIKKRYGCKYTNTKWLGNRVAISLHPGIFCPKKKAKHKNNCTSVLCSIPVQYSDHMDIHVKVICMDIECQENEVKYVIDQYNIPVKKS